MSDLVWTNAIVCSPYLETIFLPISLKGSKGFHDNRQIEVPTAHCSAQYQVKHEIDFQISRVAKKAELVT